MDMNPCLLVDAYKLGHFFMQPKGVTQVYSTWTGRSNKFMPEMQETVVFGYQYFIKRWLIDYWNKNFFEADINEIEEDFVRKVRHGFNPQYADFTRFRKLYELGYLPIEIWGLPEGTLCPTRVPDHIMFNTHEDFGWLPQYLEDFWSNANWQPSTAATIAYDRRRILQEFVDKTCDNEEITKNLAGDFSLRGMTGMEAGYISSLGHLLSFTKSATFDAYGMGAEYYDATYMDFVGLGTPSLEHSVVCQGVAYYSDLLLKGGEYKGITLAQHKNVDIKLVAEMCYLKWLLTELQPTGALSYVSDTYDFWGVVTWVLPKLRDDIINRKGVLIIRPDSGNPIDIVCGDPTETISHLKKGAIEVLADIFGVTANSKGFKVLPPYIRLIYGDAIDRTRNYEIPNELMAKGYSVENVTFGIGAYSYQFVTRDTRGYAIKATDCVMNGVEMPLFKSPKTDDGTKISPRGCVAVYRTDEGLLRHIDGLTLAESLAYPGNQLRKIFKDGEQFNRETYAEIRNRLWNGRF